MASAARSRDRGGAAKTLGDKPFVDDMRVPGMLRGAMVLTEHPRVQAKHMPDGDVILIEVRTDSVGATLASPL